MGLRQVRKKRFGTVVLTECHCSRLGSCGMNGIHRLERPPSHGEAGKGPGIQVT